MFFPAILVKALVKKAVLPTGNFKRSPHAQFIFGVIKLHMGIGIHRYDDVCMAHDVMQCLGIHLWNSRSI